MKRKLNVTKAPAFSYVVVGYMLLALLWWAILLNRQNREIRDLKEEIRIHQAGDTFSQEEIYLEYRRAQIMIWGEGCVFAFALFIGFWLIHKSYARELEVARQKKNFLLAITHELRSPLTSIRLILETLGKRKLKEADMSQLWQNGLVETERLQRLIDNILLAASLDKSYLPDRELFDISELINQQLDNIRKLYPESSIARIDSCQNGYLRGDQFGLSTIIRNFLENALKYTPPPQRVVVELNEDKRGWKILVKDNGPGIAPEERRKIFDQFYRIGSEDTRTTSGTGLGLYIVKRIADINEWEIEVSDNDPKGSVFMICIPKTGESK